MDDAVLDRLFRLATLECETDSADALGVVIVPEGVLAFLVGHAGARYVMREEGKQAAFKKVIVHGDNAERLHVLLWPAGVQWPVVAGKPWFHTQALRMTSTTPERRKRALRLRY